MYMRAKLALTVAVVALAACGSRDDTSEPLPDAGDTAQVDGIPARFHGAWDYVDGSCNPTSDLRVEVSADRVIFYESVGEVEGVSSGTDGTEVTLAMEGEGQNWDSRFRLSLQGNPERLVMQNIEYPSDPTNIRKRCAS